MNRRLISRYLLVAFCVFIPISEAHASGQLVLPLNTAGGVNSWFDHTSPTYATNGNMTRHDGTVYAGSAASATCAFGAGCYDGHNGIDFQASSGTDVYAGAAGTVRTVGWENPSDHTQGYGYHIRVWHPSMGDSTLYGHLTENSQVSGLSAGSSVAPGTKMATSGNTGSSTGPHLHFSVFNSDSKTVSNSIDPFGWTGTGSDPWSIDQGYLWTTNPPSASPAPSSTPPNVHIDAKPAGYEAKGTVHVTGWAQDTNTATGMSSVTVKVDGALAPGSASTGLVRGDIGGNSGFDYAWNTGGLSVGSHTVTVSATNAASQTTQDTLTVIVRSPYTALFWRNSSTGQILRWLMDDTVLVENAALSNSVSDPNWKIVASADMNGDGHPDILWRNTSTGQLLRWLMNGTTLVDNSALSNSVVDQNWQVKGMADMNGDGHPDIFWHNPVTGDMVRWLMNDTALIGNAAVSASLVGTNYQAAGVLPMPNGTNYYVLWHNTATGVFNRWIMADTALASNAVVSGASVTDPAWQKLGTAYMTPDGNPSLLWRNTGSGSMLRWSISDATLVGNSTVGATVADTSWYVGGMF